ncbi:integumentary mucin C.1-like [Sinocyclocheilus grahami]|uniref:integumentary mucin C.1-like n=1 Tax=Sinocyclocheilus grahami TaxID=75366 RepID=UPI0007AD04D1|nr:PREDICTED: integumentary mucin C.1-like [Sinocyclocheilus grahami]
MTIKTSELETSTSTAVPSIVTTIKTSGPDTSTSTPIPSIVTTIKTSGPETSTSTPVPSIVMTIKTSGPETETSNKNILPTSVSKDNPESTAITCGTCEPAALPTETKRETPGIGTVTPLNTFTTKDNMVITTSHNHTPKRTTPSKLKKKKLSKSKKGLRKIQMRMNHLKKKSG